jgi:hypothetical protein
VATCEQESAEIKPGIFSTACNSPSAEFTRRTQVFIHELMHVFGANDKYQGFGCGYITDTPKETTDIMCGDLADPQGRPGGWTSTSSPNQALISDLTAKEIGWKDVDGDSAIEIDDRCPLDPDNICG